MERLLVRATAARTHVITSMWSGRFPLGCSALEVHVVGSMMMVHMPCAFFGSSAHAVSGSSAIWWRLAFACGDSPWGFGLGRGAGGLGQVGHRGSGGAIFIAYHPALTELSLPPAPPLRRGATSCEMVVFFLNFITDEQATGFLTAPRSKGIFWFCSML